MLGVQNGLGVDGYKSLQHISLQCFGRPVDQIYTIPTLHNVFLTVPNGLYSKLISNTDFQSRSFLLGRLIQHNFPTPSFLLINLVFNNCEKCFLLSLIINNKLYSRQLFLTDKLFFFFISCS